jgi:sec-independent protein translocase protein TatA
MFGLSVSELLIVLVVVVLIFGPSRLPQLGSGLGKAITGFKKAAKEQDRNITPPEEKDKLPAHSREETRDGKAGKS